jgi:PKD repeat protein
VGSPNQPPVADANNPYLAAAGSELVLDGTGSYDPDGGPLPLTYAWELGDGNTGVGATPTHIYAAAGIYDVCLTVDDGAAQDTACVEAVIYDPSAGFVTGAGRIYSQAGAYTSDPALEGDAHFAFVSRYKKGASVPEGQTSFKFRTADLIFESSSYDWLVVTGSDSAKFKGSGTINGVGDYKFMLWAGDGEPDTFRIKIWEASSEAVVYDNGCDSCKAQDTGISSGNIIVHGVKK